MKPIFDYIDHNRSLFIERLLDYLRQPSISAHGIGMGEVAQYLVAWLAKLGLEAALVPTAGWPMVLGQRHDNPCGPTVLLYGHYDVQPPDRRSSQPSATGGCMRAAQAITKASTSRRSWPWRRCWL
jgi:acetylornithine deacetylase/succinyl-diaminopimelate desuccinylase-like protein